MPLMIVGNPKRVPEPLTYRGLEIELWTMDRGAVHCDKQHDFRARNCAVCAADVGASQVFVAFVAGEPASLDHDDKEDAVAAAQQHIDDELDPEGELTSSTGPKGGKGRFSGLDPRAAVRHQMKELGWGKEALAQARRAWEQEEAAKKAALPSGDKDDKDDD